MEFVEKFYTDTIGLGDIVELPDVGDFEYIEDSYFMVMLNMENGEVQLLNLKDSSTLEGRTYADIKAFNESLVSGELGKVNAVYNDGDLQLTIRRSRKL